MNGNTPLYTLPGTIALLAGATFTGATFTGAVTTTGLSLGDNNLNFKIGTTSYSLTTTMLKALVDNSTLWRTAATDISTCMKLSGINAVTGDITFSTNTYKFCGALPTEIAYLSGVTSSISTQLNNQQSLITALQSSVTSCAPKASPTFTGTVTIPGATRTGIISFPTSMTLATVVSAARLILWPGTGNDWYGFGMNGNTLNYNVTTGAVHKFYCSSTVCAIISSATTTFNNNVTCGSNSLTCGTLTCTGGTMGGNTIATTNQLPNLTGYLKQGTTLTPVYYNTGRCISLGCDSANNSYLDFHCVDAATTSQTDVRILES